MSKTTKTTKKKPAAGATARQTDSSASITQTVGRDEIAMRAYTIYLSGQGGTELDHWLQAERELLGDRVQV